MQSNLKRRGQSGEGGILSRARHEFSLLQIKSVVAVAKKVEARNDGRSPKALRANISETGLVLLLLVLFFPLGVWLPAERSEPQRSAAAAKAGADPVPGFAAGPFSSGIKIPDSFSKKFLTAGTAVHHG